MTDLASDRVDGEPRGPIITALELPGARALATLGHDLVRGNCLRTHEAVLEPLIWVASAAAVPASRGGAVTSCSLLPREGEED